MAWLSDWGSGWAAPASLGPLLELDADALAVDRVLVAIPGEALDPDLGDVAAEAAVAFEQDHRHAGSRGGEGRRESTGTAADHEHVGPGKHRRGCGPVR